MAFVISKGTVLMYATPEDVENIDQRVFEANEGLDEDVVEGFLIRSTERINTMITDSKWWDTYNDGYVFDPNNILNRQNDFTDACVFYCLSYYLLPTIADFGTEDNAEVNKIEFYKLKFFDIIEQILEGGDWYDWDGDGVIDPIKDYTPSTPELERLFR